MGDAHVHEEITYVKSVGSDRRGKIHTPLALSSVHTTLDKKIKEREAEWENIGKGQTRTRKGDRGARLGVLVGVPIYTRFVLATTKGASGRSVTERGKKRQKRDRAQRLNEQDRIQSS